MNFNIKKIVTAACMAAFLATSFMPGTSEAANGRMSLAQAQQQVKRPLHHKIVHKHGPKHHKKQLHHRYDKHRPAMHTRGPVSRTWVPIRHAPPHHKFNGHAGKPHRPVIHKPPLHHNHPEIRR